MLAIELRFPAARYHATPWGRHVNEGEVEWPPSPWRLMRALLATWYHKASREVGEPVMRRLIDKLCAELPQYALPAVDSGHTRHYMPLYNSGRDDKTARVFDAFLHVDPAEALRVVWPAVALDDEERAVLALLLERLGYLGRAESWVEAALGNGGPEALCRPLSEGVAAGGDDVVRLLVPQDADGFLQWRAALSSGNGNGKSARRAKGPEVPADLFSALQAEVGDLRKAGWSQPPGSRYVEYARPKTDVASERRIRRTLNHPTVARYAVTSAVSPRLLDAISLADRVHQTLVKISDGHPVFSGKTDEGILRGHGHVHIYCEANGPNSGRITHVTLHAPLGFDDDAQAALEALRKVWGHGGHDVRLVLLGVGIPGDFAGMNIRAGQCALFAKSRVWLSSTPFVPTRHPKRGKMDEFGRLVGSPEHDLCRLLRERGFPDPIAVEHLPDAMLGGHRTSWLEFRTIRYHGNGLRAANRGWGFRLEFAEEVPGPIAAGYGAHFGLGLFNPITSRTPSSKH